MSDGLLIIAGLLTIVGLLFTLSLLAPLQKNFEADCSAGDFSAIAGLVDGENISAPSDARVAVVGLYGFGLIARIAAIDVIRVGIVVRGRGVRPQRGWSLSAVLAHGKFGEGTPGRQLHALPETARTILYYPADAT